MKSSRKEENLDCCEQFAKYSVGWIMLDHAGSSELGPTKVTQGKFSVWVFALQYVEHCWSVDCFNFGKPE